MAASIFSWSGKVPSAGVEGLTQKGVRVLGGRVVIDPTYVVAESLTLSTVVLVNVFHADPTVPVPVTAFHLGHQATAV